MIEDDPDLIKFRCTSSDDTIEEIWSYNQLLDKVESCDNEQGEYRFKSIDDHQGPLKPSDLNYKGSQWNVRVNWENGESTYEPLSVIVESDPVSCTG